MSLSVGGISSKSVQYLCKVKKNADIHLGHWDTEETEQLQPYLDCGGIIINSDVTVSSVYVNDG